MCMVSVYKESNTLVQATLDSQHDHHQDHGRIQQHAAQAEHIRRVPVHREWSQAAVRQHGQGQDSSGPGYGEP